MATETNNSKRKTNGYSSFKLHAKRDRKRNEAEARQFKYDNLTLKEKLATLVEGGSKKQRARLEAQMAAAKPAKVKKA